MVRIVSTMSGHATSFLAVYLSLVASLKGLWSGLLCKDQATTVSAVTDHVAVSKVLATQCAGSKLIGYCLEDGILWSGEPWRTRPGKRRFSLTVRGPFDDNTQHVMAVLFLYVQGSLQHLT